MILPPKPKLLLSLLLAAALSNTFAQAAETSLDSGASAAALTATHLLEASSR